MNYKKNLNDLKELLRIRSISSDPSYKSEIVTAAKWLRDRLTNLEFDCELIETSFNPVVFGQNMSAGEEKPTVLVYGHYDVQEIGEKSEWKSEPFEPCERGGNLYARGAADDKGQLYTWIAAIEGLMSKEGRLPVNVKFMIEGAEEEGSRGLSEFVRRNKKKLRADCCVISDSHCLNERQPLITYGLRGLSYFDVVVTSLKSDVHSGIYGGNVLNSINVLAGMIAQMKDEKGVIKIDGFYENVRILGDKEKSELAEYPVTNEQILSETGALVVAGEESRSIPERAGARPTLDVNGVWGGYGGVGARTIIPAQAGAKISMRLVQKQTPEEIGEKFREFVRKITPKGVRVEVSELAGAEPVLLNRHSKYFGVAEGAYNKVFGKKPLYELSGGSIGVVTDIKNVLGIDSILMGYGLPDDNLHGPNEKLSLSMFEKGIMTNTAFLRGLGA